MTILEPKKEKKIFLKIYFFSKMLNFQDFSKFSKILKSTVQYLSRDISTIKIGQFLRQSHKKHRKPLFCPTALKIKKLTYHPMSFLITFHTIFFLNWTTTDRCFFWGGGVASSQQSILSLLAYLYLNYIACKGLSCVFGHPMFIYLLMYTIRDDPDFLSF